MTPWDRPSTPTTCNGRQRQKQAHVRAVRDIPEEQSGADGMALDRDDRLYVTTVAGVQVFDAAGTYLGTIKVPRQCAMRGFARTGQARALHRSA